MNFLCCNLSHGHIQSTPWSLWNNVFSKSHISNHQIGPPCTPPPCTTISPARRCQSCPTVERKQPLHKLGGGRWSVNLGHPAAEAALQLMRERERWRQSLITARWPCLLLQQREGERGKSPSPRQRQQQQQAAGLFVSMHAMQHFFRAFLECVSHSPVIKYMHPCVCVNVVRNAHKMLSPPQHAHTQQTNWFPCLVSV